MPAALAQFVVPAVVGAGATIFGSHKQSQASSQATQAQQKATADALAYQREKDARIQANRDKALAAYNQAWQAWYARNPNGVSRYGIPAGVTLPGSAPASAPSNVTAAAAAAQRMVGSAPQRRRTLGNLAMIPQAPPANPMPQQTPLPTASAPMAQPPGTGMTDMAPGQADVPALMPARRNLGQLGGWTNWQNYGVS